MIKGNNKTKQKPQNKHGIIVVLLIYEANLGLFLGATKRCAIRHQYFPYRNRIETGQSVGRIYWKHLDYSWAYRRGKIRIVWNRGNSMQRALWSKFNSTIKVEWSRQLKYGYYCNFHPNEEVSTTGKFEACLVFVWCHCCWFIKVFLLWVSFPSNCCVC